MIPRDINGNSQVVPFQTRTLPSGDPDRSIKNHIHEKQLESALLLALPFLQGKAGGGLRDYSMEIMKTGKYSDLQLYLLSCDYSPAKKTLVDVEKNSVEICTADALQNLRYFCFMVEIHRREEDAYSYRALSQNYRNNGIDQSGLAQFLFTKAHVYGDLFKDNVEYYMRGKNPFSRVREMMTILDNKEIH